MALRLGDEAPNFDADTTQGRINFHDWIGDGWVVLFSHPADFTPVCTTELGRTAALSGEFARRGVKPIAKLAAFTKLFGVIDGPGSRELSEKVVVKLPALAVTEMLPEVAPAVTLAPALPFKSVFTVVGFTEPLPPVTEKVTGKPVTGRFCVSRT